MSIISIDSLLSSFLNSNQINSLNSSGVQLTDFLKDVKNLINNKVNFNFLNDLNKLNTLGLNVKSLSDLEKVKDIDANKLISNSIDIRSLKANLSIVQNTGLDIGFFNEQYKKVSSSGLNINKITNLLGSLDSQGLLNGLLGQGNDLLGNITSNLTGQGTNLVNNLTGQGSNLLGNLTGQGTNLVNNLTGQGTNLVNNLTGQGSALGNLTGQGTSLFNSLTGKTSITNNVASNAANQNTQTTPQNQSVESIKKTRAIQILVPSQYIDVYVLSKWGGEPALLTHSESKQMVWHDKDFDRPDFVPGNLTSPQRTNDEGTTNFDINIHLGYPGGKNVGNWSLDGSQCFATADELREFFALCDKHVAANGNKFSYTLATKNDWDQAVKNVAANKISPPPATTKPTATTTTTAQESLNNDTLGASKTATTTNNPTTPPSNDTSSSFPDTTKTPTENLNKPVSATESNTTNSNSTTNANKIEKPSVFKNKIDVMAFQVWSNKNGYRLSTDGEWGEKTNSAWVKSKIKYIESLRGLTDSNLRLVHARLQPYGLIVPITEYSKAKDKYVTKSYTYTASFSKNKLSSSIDYTLNYNVIFYDTEKFKIVDNGTKQTLCAGVYLNGGRVLRILEGINANNTISEDSAWTAIRKCLF